MNFKGFYLSCCLVAGLAFLLLMPLASWGQSAGDFRSFAAGNWNDVNTWERFDGGSWINPAPSTPTDADGVITIQAGHIVTVTASVSVDQVVVQNTGQITVNNGVTLSIAAGSGTDMVVDPGGVIDNEGGVSIASGFGGSATVSISGTLNNSGTINGASTTRLTFQDGSIYDHQQDGGTVPTSTWGTTALCQITGSTSTGPAGLSQTFGNFTWNTPDLDAGTAYDMGLTASSVFNGDFRIEGSGNVILVLSDASATISFNADFVVSGSSVLAVTNSGTITADIGGDFVYESSSSSYFSSVGTGSINLAGNFTFSSGSLAIFDASGAGTLTFDGATLQTFDDSGGTFDGTADPDFVVSGGAEVAILGEGAFDGSGDFTLNGTSTLRLGSTHTSGAIQTGTTAGNIRVGGTRTFNAGATLIYNGSGAQFLGDGFPSDVNLTVNNVSGVTLSGTTTIATGRTLTLTDGNLSIDANALTLNGTMSVTSGALEGGSSSNLTIGGTGDFGTLSFASTTTLNNFTLNRTSSGNVTLGSDLSILGTFTQTDGDLTLNSNTFNINSAFSRTSGSIVGDASATLVVDGTGALPGTVGMSGALDTFTLNRSAATFTTAGSVTLTNLNLTAGTFDNQGTITMATNGVITRTENGSMSSAPAATSSYDVVYNNSSTTTSGPELPTSTTALDDLTKQGVGQLDLNSAITINGILTLTSGIFNAGTNSIDFKGDFVSNASATLTSSSITFSGTTIISGSATPTFNDITITGTLTPTANLNINGNLVNDGTLNSGTATVTFGGTTTVSGSSVSAFDNVVISSSSTLNAPSGEMSITGDFTNSGTFNANGGTLVFAGITTITGVTQFASITVDGTLTGPSDLSLTGNFTNNGTFSAGSGTVTFNGSSIQSVSGTTATTFNNIDVTNTAGPPAVSIDSDQNLTGILTLATGSVFDADGSSGTAVFTLVSNASGDASIAELPSGASVTGNVTAQRYMEGEGRIWRYIATCIEGQTVADWQDDFPISGDFTGADINTNPSMYYYDESVSGLAEEGWTAYPTTSNTEALDVGTGYSVFIREASLATTVDNRGPVHQGDFSFAVGFQDSPNDDAIHDGWNLVGNPYPSAINWDDASWTKVGMSNTIHIRDNASGVYATYTTGAGGTNGGSANIASGQAFWVQATASPTLVATESAKVGTTPTFFKEGGPQNLLRVSLSDGTLNDEIIIHFNEGAQDTYDDKDGQKKYNSIFNLYTRSEDDVPLAINTYQTFICGKAVALETSNIDAGEYSLNFSSLSSFEDAIEIKLVDNYLNVAIDVTEEPVYTFEVTADEATIDDRFSVIFNEVIDVSLAVEGPEMACGDMTSVTVENSQTGVMYQLLLNDSEILDPVEGNGESIVFELLSDDLSMDDNQVQVSASNTECSGQLLTNEVVIKREAINTALDITAEGIVCEGNGSQVTIASSENGVSYEVMINDVLAGNPVTGDGENLVIPVFPDELQPGENTIRVQASSQGCDLLLEQETVITQLVINPSVDITAPVAVCEGGEVFVDLASSQVGVSYQVLVNDQPIDGLLAGTGQALKLDVAYEVLKSGENTLQVKAYGSDCAEQLLEESVVVDKRVVDKTLEVAAESTVCNDQEGSVKLVTTQSGVTYQLVVNDQSSADPVVGDGNPLVFAIGNEILLEGSNSVSFTASIEGCSAVTLVNNAQIDKNTVEPVITVNSNMFISNYDEGNQWYFEGEKIEGATDKAYSPEVSGLYLLEVSADGCIGTTETEYLVTGTDSYTKKEVIIYPNPAQGHIYISFDRSISDMGHLLTIFNSRGKEVYRDDTQPNKTHKLDVSNWSSGVYLLKLTGSKKSIIHRIVKE